MSYEPSDMRKLINLMESTTSAPTINYQRDELEQLIELKYEVQDLLSPELLVENWLTDKIADVKAKITNAIEAYKKDPNAQEARDLDDALIGYNNEIINRFQAVGSDKIRVVYYSDSYEDITRIYKKGLTPEDVGNIKHDTKKYPDAGNVELKYSDDFHFFMFGPGAKFNTVATYTKATGYRSGPTFKYAVIFDAPKKVWSIDDKEIAQNLGKFKPSAGNDNAVGILALANKSYKGGAIVFPVLMNKKEMEKEYSDELKTAGIQVNTIAPGANVFSAASGGGSSAGDTAAVNAKDLGDTDAVNAKDVKAKEKEAAPVAAQKVELHDYETAAAALKQIKKDIEDGKLEMDDKTLKDLEELKKTIEELIAAVAAKTKAPEIVPVDFSKLVIALQQDMKDPDKVKTATSLYNAKLKPYVTHWAKKGGFEARSLFTGVADTLDKFITNPDNKTAKSAHDKMADLADKVKGGLDLTK